MVENAVIFRQIDEKNSSAFMEESLLDICEDLWYHTIMGRESDPLFEKSERR